MHNLDQKYQETLDYLYSFVDYSLTRAFRFSPEKFDLKRVYDLLEELGNPQKQYKIIHVAGTKGKGSTAALINSALYSAGYRTGFYTSPHLQEFTERIQVDCKPISKEDLITLVDEIKPILPRYPQITTFEITTVASFLYFARQKVQAAVIEVGLGGRLDATNVVDPDVTVITSLSYDHMSVLGDTLAKIAYEKAGIIKTGKPVVISPQKKEARDVLLKVAAERSSRLIQVGLDYLYAPVTHNREYQSFVVWNQSEQPLIEKYIDTGGKNSWVPARLVIPLLGLHQVENAATAYTALKVAGESGISVPEMAIQKGFAEVFWPGRFEFLRLSPPVIVDSAHNRDSALRLRLAVEDYIPGQKVILVFGASEDKDIEGMFTELLPVIKCVIATQSTHPRAMEPFKLVELAQQFGIPAQVILPVENAVESAIQMAEPDDAVLVAGSLFVAAAARETMKNLGQPIRLYD